MKRLLNNIVPGGFDSKMQFILIKYAIQNAKSNFSQMEDGNIALYSTEVFRLAESIYPLVKDIIESTRL